MVRKHLAPEGALRLSLGVGVDHEYSLVRKHPAPEGALRLDGVSVELGDLLSESTQHQKVQ